MQRKRFLARILDLLRPRLARFPRSLLDPRSAAACAAASRSYYVAVSVLVPAVASPVAAMLLSPTTKPAHALPSSWSCAMPSASSSRATLAGATAPRTPTPKSSDVLKVVYQLSPVGKWVKRDKVLDILAKEYQASPLLATAMVRSCIDKSKTVEALDDEVRLTSCGKRIASEMWTSDDG